MCRCALCGPVATHDTPWSVVLCCAVLCPVQGRYVHEATKHIPIIGDGDTGYGNAMNVKRTVKGYADAGFAGGGSAGMRIPRRVHALGLCVLFFSIGTVAIGPPSSRCKLARAPSPFNPSSLLMPSSPAPRTPLTLAHTC